MPKLSGKTWLYVGGGAILLYLLYRWYQNQQANAAPNPAATDTSGQTAADAGYAALAGQEQGDISSLSAQEQQDIGAIQSTLSTLRSAQESEQTTVAGLVAQAGQNQPDVSSQPDTSTPTQQQTVASKVGGGTGTTTQELARVMAGEKKQAAQLAALRKRLGTHKHKPKNTSGHVNANHPSGTAGHAHAPRSHAPKRPRVHR